jgi:hypothetical protein
MHDELQRTVKTLNEFIWERRLEWGDVEEWLDQFGSSPGEAQAERLHALFLLSHFSYFNSWLMRVLLRSLYRDLVQYPIMSEKRRELGNTTDLKLVVEKYNDELKAARFIGIGNPSESGTHLLYYFRQENELPVEIFVHPHELFEGQAGSARLVEGVTRLIFLDDFCGSGTQAERYSRRLLVDITRLSPRMKLCYYPLFATSKGLSRVRERTHFTEVEALCELDDSFRSLDESSRYFREPREGIDRDYAKRLCQRIGEAIEPRAPLGFGGCQLLLGFAHNIPNNTLPIFWSEGNRGSPWLPLFRRYTKGIGW